MTYYKCGSVYVTQNSNVQIESAEGSIANFTTSLALPLVALKAYITAQGGGGTPSAPVAITGFDNVKIYQCGVNLWDEEWESGYISFETGVNVASLSTIRSTNYFPVEPNTSYYAYLGTNAQMYAFAYDENNNYLGVWNASRGWVTDGNYSNCRNEVITTPENARYLRIRTNSVYGTTYNNDISINYPSTDTQYHAYNPNSTEYTIQLGQTCYGGYIDKSTGKLVITWATIDLNDNILNWDYRSTQKIFRSIAISNIKLPISTQDTFNGLCEVFTIATSSNVYNNAETYDNCIACSSDGRLWVSAQAYNNNLNAFKNAIDGKLFAYELATPVQTDITIPDITALVGENNIFADSGDIEVKYKKIM